jgi:DNA adenine methylase
MFTIGKSGMSKDSTAAKRQKKRLKRLNEQGVYRKTALVHEDCEYAFNILKNYLAEPDSAYMLNELSKKIKKKKPVNVSKVRQLSPFRYPGGKTWLVPEIKKWIKEISKRPKYFVEPFTGGGIISLTIAAEKLAQKVIMVEIDQEVSSVWKTIFEEPEFLCNKIKSFEVNIDNVKAILHNKPDSVYELGFRTIVKNRTHHGGKLAPGASLVKAGENGKGLSSRWYPDTLVKRIRSISQISHRIEFHEGDGFDFINKYKNINDTLFFIDPPYTLGGKKAGKRLYLHNEIDHLHLFKEINNIKGQFILTYSDSEEAKNLALDFGLNITKIPMRNTHNNITYELFITKG